MQIIIVFVIILFLVVMALHIFGNPETHNNQPDTQPAVHPPSDQQSSVSFIFPIDLAKAGFFLTFDENIFLV